MNNDAHRLVFNKSRCCMMAVAETASNCSKSPSAASKVRRRLSRCFFDAKKASDINLNVSIRSSKSQSNSSSTSSAGISGIAGNTAVRTGDAETGLKPIFDADKVQKEINAQVAMTQAFGQQASKAIGDHAATQVNEAARLRIRANGLDANDPERSRLSNEAAAIEAKWGDNGTLRLLAHTVVGGLTGGLRGAAGAAARTLAAPLAADALANAGITGPLATSITALAGTAAGALMGGTAGAAAGFNEVVNNYLTPRENLAPNKAARSCVVLTKAVFGVGT